MSNQPDYSESEKRYKAFIEHGSALTPHSTIIFFMTASYCVISAVAVCETLSEGKADYCMIVCE